MAIVNRSTAKTYFNTGDKPTESEFSDFIDSAIFQEDFSNFGKSLVSAQTATSVRNILGSGTIGDILFRDTTQVSAQNNIGGGTVGKNVFTATTTASAQQNIGGGTVGRQIFEATTTASATNIVNQTATSTAQGISYLTTPVSWTNNTLDADNDIDYTIGVIDHDDGSGQSLATTALTKRLDATFVAGNNQGGLDTGTKANSTWYQIFAITNNTTNAIDYLFSASRTSPTIPSGWTRRRWLGAIRTNASGNIDQAYFARRTPFGQTVSFITGAYLSGVGQIPQDDTIPQNTEGYEFMSLPINPLSASSKLEVNSKGILYSNTSGSWRVAASLFRDSDLNAIGTDEAVGGGTSWGVILFPNATINSNSTNLTTFKFRAGSTISSTMYLNGYGGRYYGGSFSSYIKINEYT